MCNYIHESKRTVDRLPVPVSQARQVVGPAAHQALVSAVRRGRALPGRDLHSGHRLPASELAQGHYMTPRNFERALARMNAQPQRCAWCRARLPARLVAQHLRPHNHRELIDHHFHPQCWQARLLAIAVIFGHLRSQDVLPKRQRRRQGHSQQTTVTETVMVKMQRTFKLPQRNAASPRRRAGRGHRRRN